VVGAGRDGRRRGGAHGPPRVGGRGRGDGIGVIIPLVILGHASVEVTRQAPHPGSSMQWTTTRKPEISIQRQYYSLYELDQRRSR
jgi:hypothetical protein